MPRAKKKEGHRMRVYVGNCGPEELARNVAKCIHGNPAGGVILGEQFARKAEGLDVEGVRKLAEAYKVILI